MLFCRGSEGRIPNYISDKYLIYSYVSSFAQDFYRLLQQTHLINGSFGITELFIFLFTQSVFLLLKAKIYFANAFQGEIEDTFTQSGVFLLLVMFCVPRKYE
jgi:hypothetical protein